MLPYLGARYGIDYDRAEDEVKPSIMAVAKLRHAAHDALRKRGE
jgi:hypothetical protein